MVAPERGAGVQDAGRDPGGEADVARGRAEWLVEAVKVDDEVDRAGGVEQVDFSVDADFDGGEVGDRGTGAGVEVGRRRPGHAGGPGGDEGGGGGVGDGDVDRDRGVVGAGHRE